MKKLKIYLKYMVGRNFFKNKNLFLFVLLFSLGFVIALSFDYFKYNNIYNAPKIRDIDPKVAYENVLSNPDGYIIVDVRSESEFYLAHAANSLNLPIHYFYDEVKNVKNEKGIDLPKNKDQEIYLMCTGGRLAGVAYSFLDHYGYRNITRIKGGLSNWNVEGLPIVRGSEIKQSTAPLDRNFTE